MNEKSQFKDILIKFAILFLFATLYCLGGAEFGPGKWVRRYVATSILIGGCYWFSRDWRTLVGFPFLVLGTSLGYGADQTWLKIIKRFYCGFILGAGAAAGDWLNKRFKIAAFQTLVTVLAMVVIGVWNPLQWDARTEEFILGFIIGFLPLINARKAQ